MEALYEKLVASMGKNEADALLTKLEKAIDKDPKKAVNMLKMGSNFL